MAFIEEQVASERFQNAYMALCRNSLLSQSGLDDETIEYLLNISALLTGSPKDEHLSVAGRIANEIIRIKELNAVYLSAATYILSQLNIDQSIDLAVKESHVGSGTLRNFTTAQKIDFLHENRTNRFVFNGRSIKANRFQTSVVERFDAANDLLISAPTSAGKTFILTRLLVERIRAGNYRKVCVLAPTRALVRQIQEELISLVVKEELPDFFISSVPNPPPASFSENKKLIFIFTQERLAWFLAQTDTLTFELMIVDEVHKIGDGHRGIVLEEILSRFARLSPRSKIVLCGPNVTIPKDKNVLSFLAGRIFDVVGSNTSLIPQNIYAIDKSPGTSKLSINQYCDGELVGKIENIQLNSSTARAKLICQSVMKYAPDGGTIVYVSTASRAEEIAVALMDFFPQLESTSLSEVIKVAKDNVHGRYRLTKTLAHGIAFHYGNMPSILREEIEHKFKNGDIKYLVCTSTLIEGVNLNAKNVFITTPKRSSSKMMSNLDFWNLAGRAGRLGSEFVGNIFCLRLDMVQWENIKFKKPIENLQKATFVSSEIIGCLISYIEGEEYDKSIVDEVYLDFLFSYFYLKFLEEDLDVDAIDAEDLERLYATLDSVTLKLSVGPLFLKKHFGINPLKLEEMYRDLQENLTDRLKMVPNFKELDKSGTSFEPLSDYLHKYLGHGLYQSRWHRILKKWMVATPVPKIVSAQIWGNKRSSKPKPEHSVIRQTLDDIENYVRFHFYKQFAAFQDLVFMIDPTQETNEIGLWLEFGSNNPVQIELMGFGLSRTAAIYVSEKLGEIDADINGIMKELIRFDVSTIGDELGETAIKNIENTISYLKVFSRNT